MHSGQVRIPPHHLGTLPSPQFLQDMERSAILCMPACPRMTQIMPSEVFKSHRPASCAPRFGSRLENRLTFKDEHILIVLAFPSTKNRDSIFRKRYSNGFFCLGLIRVNPGSLAFEIDLLPLKMRHVGSAKSGFQCEGQHS